jgi:hypothetical protein
MAKSNSDKELAEHFRDLETPMRELGAMTEIVMMVWKHPELGGPSKHSDRMDIALDRLELLAQGFTSDYTAKLEQE